MATTIHKISGNYFGLPKKLATFIYLKVQNLSAFDDYYRIRGGQPPPMGWEPKKKKKPEIQPVIC
jgi:hypothetical protein